jgi:hypothetical protein
MMAMGLLRGRQRAVPDGRQQAEARDRLDVAGEDGIRTDAKKLCGVRALPRARSVGLVATATDEGGQACHRKAFGRHIVASEVRRLVCRDEPGEIRMRLPQ